MQKSNGANIYLNMETGLVHNMIWPNPSDYHFTLRAIGYHDDVLNTEIRVIDINGKQVYSASGISGHEFQFGEGFRAGVYFVEIVTGNNRTYLKVIKK